MTREISTPVELAHTNIVPGTEIVSVKGSSIPKLIRNSDYIMNYTDGELRFLADGAAVSLADLIAERGIDITYSYRVDFSDPNLFESQKEVFDEVATRVSDFTVAVSSGPINDALRVLNITTQEEYTPLSVHEKNITFTGTTPPRVETLDNITTSFKSTSYDHSRDLYSSIYSINYPSRFTPDLNPIVSLNSVSSKTTYPRILVIGGQDFLENTIEVEVPLETTDISLVTGARTLRKSTIVLKPGTDYTFSLIATMDVIDYSKLLINLTAEGLLKIRTNNLYLQLAFKEIPELETGSLLRTSTHSVNEVVNFSSNLTQSLTRFYNQASLGPIVDNLFSPPIVVLNPDTGFIFEEGIDYTINNTQKKITKLSNRRIQNLVLVVYQEERSLTVNFTLTADIVLVDYIWGSNSINWESLRKEVATTQIETLKQNQQFLTLKSVPIDESKILIYLRDDSTKTPKSTAISFNSDVRRLQIEPIPADGVYALEYTAITQPVREGTPYYANYKYGATRKVLGNRFARLMSLDDGTASREEVKSLAAGQTSVTLSRSPTDLESVLIFQESDPQEVPVVTIKSFDGVTRTLFFTAIASSGRYVIRYVTLGFDSKSLRSAIYALFENFQEGPTRTGFDNIIKAFVDTPADIQSGLGSRFVISNDEHSIGNQLHTLDLEQSLPLSNGASSLNYLPSRFNLGALFETTKGSYVRARAANNISVLEGTAEFLTGILFESDDNNRHYFFDLVGPDPRRNRISLYKSKTGFLNFDIWDNNSHLFRTSTDLTQVYYTEIIKLTAGDTTAVLSNNAYPARLDLNENDTPDLYEGLTTEFIIMPETNTFPPTFKRASIKVLEYDPPTNTVTFEAVPFSGRYVFSYVAGLAKFEETENFIAVTWKLHTLDGEPPFYRMFVNGIQVTDITLEDIAAQVIAGEDLGKSQYDTALYDVDVYEGDE